MVVMSQYTSNRFKRELTEIIANFLEKENCAKNKFPCTICVNEAQHLTPLVWAMLKGALMTHAFPEHIVQNSIRVALYRGKRFSENPAAYAEDEEHTPKPQEDEGFKLIRSPR